MPIISYLVDRSTTTLALNLLVPSTVVPMSRTLSIFDETYISSFFPIVIYFIYIVSFVYGPLTPTLIC